MGPSSVADNHLVALGDDVLYGHLNIGEGGTERRNEQLDAVGAHDVRAAPEIVADEAGRNKLVHQGHVSRVHKVRQGSAHKSLVILHSHQRRTVETNSKGRARSLV